MNFDHFSRKANRVIYISYNSKTILKTFLISQLLTDCFVFITSGKLYSYDQTDYISRKFSSNTVCDSEKTLT